MSAYLHRLIARDQSPAEALVPVVRSQSPIAAIDQRLAVDEQLGHGLGGLEAGGSELEVREVAEPEPEPLGVHEAAPVARASEPIPQPFTVPTPAPNRAPTTIHRKQIAPLTEAPVQAPVQTSPSSAARLPQLDPGPLFDLAAPTPEFDESRLHTIVREPTTALAPAPQPLPASPLEPPRARTEPLPTTSPVPPPWSPLEPAARPAPAPALAPARPLAATTNLQPIEPSPARHRAIPSRVAAPPTTDPVQVPSPQSAQVTPPRRDTERERPRPSPARASKRATRLDIDSISVIGPLNLHFPNRRWLRLRYR